MKILVLLLLLVAVEVTSGYKILCLLSTPAPSHMIVTSSICKELARRKHSVTVLTAQKDKEESSYYKQIVMPKMMETMEKLVKGMDLWQYRHKSPYKATLDLQQMGLEMTELFLSQPEVKNLIESNEKFDVVYSENFLNEAILGGMSHRFKAPLVTISPSMALYWQEYAIGNPSPTSYIPNTLLGVSHKMGFCERLQNFVFSLVEDITYRACYLSKQDEIMRKYFGNDMPPVDQLAKNVSLILINHHNSLAFPRPYVPNMIEVGGFHVLPPKPLPQDLQEFLDNAKEGVVYFSLGSNIKGSMMPEEKRDAILKAFSRLKQKVLWKWEAENLPGQPENVKISKWLPQSDILAHPNVKVFITHGGLLSQIESVVRGVPMVAIPLFAEQPFNVEQGGAVGFLRGLEFDDINESSMYEAVTDVLENPKYNEAGKTASRLMKDTPMTAMDTAIHWIEYVIRHKGAAHLRSAARDLSWYELYMLDVYFVLATVGLVALTIPLLILRVCLRKICKSKKGVNENKKNEKKNN